MIMTKPTPLQKRLVLASKSPRRSQLLELAGFNFVVHAKDTPEDFPEHMPPDEVAEFLARKKAEAAREFLDRGDVILAADSIVVLETNLIHIESESNNGELYRLATNARFRQDAGNFLIPSINIIGPFDRQVRNMY